MSISSEISRLSGNVSSAFGAVSQMGGTVPSGANSDDLATSIRSIPQSGGTTDVFWVNGLLNLQTMQVSNLDATHSDVLAAYQANKLVKMRLTYYTSATSYEIGIGDLSSYTSDGRFRFSSFVYGNLGSGYMLLYLTLIWNTDNSTETIVQVVNTTQM